jgi:hypothetical protein
MSVDMYAPTGLNQSFWQWCGGFFVGSKGGYA